MDTDGAAPAPEHDHHAVGSVADEAARLVELLAGGRSWGGAEPAGGGDAGPSGFSGDDGDEGIGSGSGSQPGAGPGAGPEPSPGTAPRAECTCGGRAPACRVCPVCQIISFISAVSPETIDRAADLVDFAATALRDLATAHRARNDTSPSTTGADAQTRAPGEPGEGA